MDASNQYCVGTIFFTTLKDEGLTINCYDRCVANKISNNKKCTIAWYVDDNKLLHIDTKVVDRILDIIERHLEN